MDVDTNASLVYGSGNNGRPQFAQFNRTGNSRTRTNDSKSQYDALQVKVDRRFRNGLLITNSYTLSRSMDYVNENTDDRHADRPRAELGALELRSPAQLRPDVRSTSCRGVRARRWLSDGARWQDHRRLAGQRRCSSLQSGTPLTIGGSGATAQHARQHGVRESERRAQGPRRARSRPALLRPGGLFAAARRGTQGNLTRNNGPEGPGFWNLDMSLFKRFAVGGTRFAEVPRRRLQRDERRALGQPRHRIQHRRPATRSARSPAPAGGQRSVRFGGRFVF